MFQCDTVRHQGLSFTPVIDKFVIFISLEIKKKTDLSFQLLFSKYIHVNSLLKFINNDQETIWLDGVKMTFVVCLGF